MHIASAEIVGQKQKDFVKEYHSEQGSMVLSWQLEAAPSDKTAEVDHFGPRSEQALLKPQEGSAEEPPAPEASSQGDAAEHSEESDLAQVPLAKKHKRSVGPLSTVTTAMDVEQDLTLKNLAVRQTPCLFFGQLPWYRVLKMLKENDNNLKQTLAELDNFIFPGWELSTATYLPRIPALQPLKEVVPCKAPGTCHSGHD